MACPPGPPSFQFWCGCKSIRSPKRPANLDTTKVDAGRALFQQGNCQGCHGGSKWTTSRVFYTPDSTNTLNNALKLKLWTATVTASGYPLTRLPAVTPLNQTMRYGGANGGLDSIISIDEAAEPINEPTLCSVLHRFVSR